MLQDVIFSFFVRVCFKTEEKSSLTVPFIQSCIFNWIRTRKYIKVHLYLPSLICIIESAMLSAFYSKILLSAASF